MPDFLEDYAEIGDSVEPGQAGFSPKSGRAVGKYLLENNPTDVDLQNAILEILGWVNTDINPNWRLNRILPVAHPIYPYLYASNIPTIRGIGAPSQALAAPILEAPPLPRMLIYPTYQYDVEFTPRPYAVISDISIPYYQNLQGIDTNGTPYSYSSAAEWIRFTDFQTPPHAETVKCTRGMMNFRTQSGQEPNGVQFADMPRLLLPNQILKFIWYQVPYRYITSPNSYITRFLGRVNQANWYNWKKGQLLYWNYNPIRYTPPVQLMNNWFLGTFSTEKWCDIEFTFLLTTRTGTDVPSNPANANWIAAGHNLQPWFKKRQFYYATSQADPPNDTDPTQWVPLWLSFPFDLLFTDPDSPNTVPATA